MILGLRAHDGSPRSPSQSRAVNPTERCERPQSNHVPHTYTRKGSNVDYLCPGGPLDPTLFATDDLAEAAS